NKTFLAGYTTDITERKRAETAIVESEQKFAKAFRSSPGAVSLTALDDGRYLDVNEEFLRTTGFARDEVIGRTTADLNVWPTQEARQHFIEALAATGRLMGLECAFRMRSGEIRQCQISSEVIELNGTKCCLNFMLDFTDRKRAEAEKAKLESQLLQAEKMESVGRLAGGVAHDFNNMLGVILGHVEMAMEDMAPAEAPLRDNLEEIRKAAERSANLTRQLLAFARKQTVAPKVLDLNETVASMFKMLRRLVGEDINLVWLPGAKLYQVKVDPSQIDQILANLCVNARDAIGGVGKLTIETANSTFDDDYCATHAEVVPGEYVKLAVADDGCGMDKATQERIFEPFFTTKGVSKGTGLGLATVYGIVKQNNGFINVTSETGKGARFEICLPRHLAAGTWPAQADLLPVPVVRGRETILVVEDEPAILDMTKKMLERLGYTVLPASTPGEAIRLAGAYTGVIHLLMTDVVMPEMNGRDLARNLLTSFPSLKRLFMSGYTADVIAHQGVLDEGVHFIQKPFSKKDLAARVSEALERG
ncbi:MAG TPA: ATP-binding protein, partial [Polyangia bacterium]